MKGSKIFASFVGATMIFTSTIPAYARTLPSYSYQQVMKQAGLKSTELQFDELNDDYEKVDGGIRGHGSGDRFLYSNTVAKDFVYEADVKFNEKKGAASLVFRAQGKYSYVANLNGETGHVVVFKFGDPADLGPSQDVKVKDSNTYHLKVVAIGNHIVYYVDDQLVLNSADYTMSNGHWGQDDSLTEGKLGLLTWESDVTYSNIKYATITDDNSPQLNGIKLNAVDGGIDKDILFQKGQYVYIANVKHDTHAVKLDLDKNEGTTVTAYNEEGNPVDYSEGLPITKDMQTYTLKATNGSAEVVYRLRLHRCQKDEHTIMKNGVASSIIQLKMDGLMTLMVWSTSRENGICSISTMMEINGVQCIGCMPQARMVFIGKNIQLPSIQMNMEQCIQDVQSLPIMRQLQISLKKEKKVLYS